MTRDVLLLSSFASLLWQMRALNPEVEKENLEKCQKVVDQIAQLALHRDHLTPSLVSEVAICDHEWSRLEDVPFHCENDNPLYYIIGPICIFPSVVIIFGVVCCCLILNRSKKFPSFSLKDHNNSIEMTEIEEKEGAEDESESVDAPLLENME